MPKPDFRDYRFFHATSGVGASAAITIPKRPGVRFRIVEIELSYDVGTGPGGLQITGLDAELNPDGTPQGYLVNVEIGSLVKAGRGLLGKENTDLVIATLGVATATAEINVGVVAEPFNA